MQVLGWDHLRFALAVYRGRSLAAAARALDVELSTASRRVQALEEQAGAKLFLRTARGLEPTDAGRAVVAAAMRVETEVVGLERTLAAESGARRVVRLAMTEGVAERFVATGARRLAKALESFELEIVTGNEPADLARGQADLAVRLLRPRQRGLVAKRIGTLRYAVYGSREHVERSRPAADLAGHRVVLGTGTLASSDEARWMEQASMRARVVMRASSLIALRAAALAGLGLVVLPTVLGDQSPGLVSVLRLPDALERPVFLVMHQQLRADRRVRAVADLVEQILGAVYGRASSSG